MIDSENTRVYKNVIEFTYEEVFRPASSPVQPLAKWTATLELKAVEIQMIPRKWLKNSSSYTLVYDSAIMEKYFFIQIMHRVFQWGSMKKWNETSWY